NEKPIDFKCRAASEQLAAWRRISEGMAVPDFVWWLLRETGIYAARGAYPDGKARQANLDALYQRALDGQKAGSMRLSDFIADLNEARETGQSDSDDHPSLGEGDDFVRVMTMHKSKGLEFPVVILMDLQKSIRRKRSDEKLRMDVSVSGGALGLYLPAVRRQRNSVMDSQGAEAFDVRALRKRISEETRVLYVAMTRAQQKLCMAASVKDGDEALWSMRSRAARIWGTRSMLDMIMPAVLKRVALPGEGETSEDALWRVACVSGKAIDADGDTELSALPELREILSRDEPMLMYLPEKTDPTPLKTSVTTLTRLSRAVTEEDSEETVEVKRRTEEAVRTFRLGSVPSRPAFLEEEKAEAASAGTATHRFLRLIDLDAFRREGADTEKTVRQEAERMKSSGILSEEEASLIRLKGVAAFLRSGLGKRMLQSPDVRREASFTMRIDPHAPTMVQGIVDCAFREGDGWILIDYKTDRDTDPATFVPRHEAQMNWYRTAMERLTRLPVTEMWLFALRVGKAYPVERREVIC
ncbi:MAG: PD-(D/E)XK nuclease family protein, partial [Lachnospiraceae bacterium]|nr:PD-(D/E)XK nuclease family protein [Lachnospiraceae bacterium]